MPRGRDEFNIKVKDNLAKRAGMKCSICSRTTCGPCSDGESAVNMGKAAHITAASEGGPRYDATLSQEERTSIDNGIWLCAYHADLIDKDPEKYSIETLKQIREKAEKLALNELEASAWSSLGEFPDLNVRITAGTAYFENMPFGGAVFIIQSHTSSPVTIRNMEIRAKTSKETVQSFLDGFGQKINIPENAFPSRIGIQLKPLEGNKKHDGFLLEKGSTCRYFFPINQDTLYTLFGENIENNNDCDLELTCTFNNNVTITLVYHHELCPIIIAVTKTCRNMLDRIPPFNINLHTTSSDAPDMSPAGTLNKKPISIHP